MKILKMPDYSFRLKKIDSILHEIDKKITRNILKEKYKEDLDDILCFLLNENEIIEDGPLNYIITLKGLKRLALGGYYKEYRSVKINELLRRVFWIGSPLGLIAYVIIEIINLSW